MPRLTKPAGPGAVAPIATVPAPGPASAPESSVRATSAVPGASSAPPRPDVPDFVSRLLPEPPPSTELVLAVDPGDVHVGWVEFAAPAEPTAWDEWWVCSARELTPYEAARSFATGLLSDRWTAVALEGFWLRPDLAALQAGSPMGTSQLIGFFRFLFEIYVTNLERQRPGEPHTVLSVQLPAVQPAVQAWLKRRHRPLVAVSDGLGPHVKSAELHGYEYLRTAYGGRDQQGRGTG